MANSTNKITHTLTQTDSVNTDIISRLIGPVTFSGSVGQFAVSSVPSSSVAQTVTLPTTSVYQFYLKNMMASSTSQSRTLTVTLTPQGGSSAVVQTLGPGSVMTMWHAASSSTYGFTALSLSASEANISYEIFLGG